ncbi:MAG: hypothetical protein AB8B69_22120 [Chitinophagales bacterium]
MMKRRTFINLTGVLGASFCSGLSASAQILQPSLPSFISSHVGELKSDLLQTSSELDIQNRYQIAENLLGVKQVLKEEYKGEDYVFCFKNRLGNLVKLSKKNGVSKAVFA